MTIYEALKAELGREPTNLELKARVQHVISEVNADALIRRWEDANPSYRTAMRDAGRGHLVR